jgi:hypothetical protein
MNTFTKEQVAAKIEEAIFEIVEAAAERGDENCGGCSISLHSACEDDGSTSIIFDASDDFRRFSSPGNGKPSTFLGAIKLSLDPALEIEIDEALEGIDDAAVLRFAVAGVMQPNGKVNVQFQ